MQVPSTRRTLCNPQGPSYRCRNVLTRGITVFQNYANPLCSRTVQGTPIPRTGRTHHPVRSITVILRSSNPYPSCDMDWDTPAHCVDLDRIEMSRPRCFQRQPNELWVCETPTSGVLRINCTGFDYSPWPESASELYRPSDSHLSAKLVTFANRGWHVVSVTNPTAVISVF
jgi:hypothetical protein